MLLSDTLGLLLRPDNVSAALGLWNISYTHEIASDSITVPPTAPMRYVMLRPV